MLGPANYISFLTVVGFFVGTSFGILHAEDPSMLLFWPLVITVIFYILSVAVASYFIGTTEVKKNIYLNTEYFETKYDSLLNSLTAREKDIKDGIDFRLVIEKEEHDEAVARLNKARSKKRKVRE